jgi:hypothetical protein
MYLEEMKMNVQELEMSMSVPKVDLSYDVPDIISSMHGKLMSTYGWWGDHDFWMRLTTTNSWLDT